jgi:F-type H+-transporting ATPase subunit epsilon
MFQLTIALTDSVFYQGEVEILNIQTSDGMRGILTNHVPLVDCIVPSQAAFRDKDGANHIVALGGGWLFVKKDRVDVYVNTAEFDADIDVAKAIRDRDKAIKALAEKIEEDKIRSLRLKMRLDKAINRINVGKKDD